LCLFAATHNALRFFRTPVGSLTSSNSQVEDAEDARPSPLSSSAAVDFLKGISFGDAVPSPKRKSSRDKDKFAGKASDSGEDINLASSFPPRNNLKKAKSKVVQKVKEKEKDRSALKNSIEISRDEDKFVNPKSGNKKFAVLVLSRNCYLFSRSAFHRSVALAGGRLVYRTTNGFPFLVSSFLSPSRGKSEDPSAGYVFTRSTT
jgi:hypothetical protein